MILVRFLLLVPNRMMIPSRASGRPGSGPLLSCAVLLALGFVSLLGAWTYEQIEPAGNWSWVETEVMPTGEACVCYRDAATGHIFVARRDSTWHKDDLGPGSTYTVTRHLVRGPHSRPAVLLTADTAITYAVDTDSGWSVTHVHWPDPVNCAFLAFDTLGDPTVLYGYYPGVEALSSRHRQSGVWTSDLIATAEPTLQERLLYPPNFVLGADNLLYFAYGHLHWGTSGEWCYLFADYGHTGAWTEDVVGDWYEAMSVAPGLDSGYSICTWSGVYHGGPFRCDNERLESLGPESGVLRVDAQDRRQIVYRLDVLKHAYNTGQWHIDTLPEEMDYATYDFATDLNSLPLVAFVSDSGIFLATGEAVGVAEKIPQAVREPLRLPAIVRGMLWLPRIPEGSDPLGNPPGGVRPLLLDISGRKVLELHTGANDVSPLAPGVYFVRSESDHRAQKVVIER